MADNFERTAALLKAGKPRAVGTMMRAYGNPPVTWIRVPRPEVPKIKSVLDKRPLRDYLSGS